LTWLHRGCSNSCYPSFGNTLLARRAASGIPSAVVARSWNLAFLAGAFGGYRLWTQKCFALDPRSAS